jgi:transposase-like protein
MLALRGYFIRCPKCKKPMFDKREVPLTGRAKVKCPHCGYEFEMNFDEPGE